MKRIAPATVLTAIVYVSLIGLVILAFAAQQSRITTADARYDKLFAAYSQLSHDCAIAADCVTTTPAPGAVKGPVGPEGSIGPRGFPGTQGNTGSPGARGTRGPAGPAGKDGAQGAAGAPGSNGTDGRDGADGKPPTGWTYVDALGISHTCSKSEPFDPASPTYTCD